jgi:putative transposase
MRVSGLERKSMWESSGAACCERRVLSRISTLKIHNGPRKRRCRSQLPPAVGQDSVDDFRDEVAAELEAQEAQAHAALQQQGRRFLGAERVNKISPYERVTSFEALRDRNPTFAVGREQGDAWRIAGAAVRAFRASYRVALELWRTGIRSVVFPAGTWWMRTFHRASVTDFGLTV